MLSPEKVCVPVDPEWEAVEPGWCPPLWTMIVGSWGVFVAAAFALKWGFDLIAGVM